MMNHVVLVGRLCQDVEVKHTESGVALARFNVAVTRNFKNSQGERDTDFVNCLLWRKSAEIFAQHTCKGSLVGISGQVRTHNYENKEGQKVYVTEIAADDFSFLESKAITESRRLGTPVGALASSMDNGAILVDPLATNNGQAIDISDDDLPF